MCLRGAVCYQWQGKRHCEEPKQGIKSVNNCSWGERNINIFCCQEVSASHFGSRINSFLLQVGILFSFQPLHFTYLSVFLHAVVPYEAVFFFCVFHCILITGLYGCHTKLLFHILFIFLMHQCKAELCPRNMLHHRNFPGKTPITFEFQTVLKKSCKLSSLI